MYCASCSQVGLVKLADESEGTHEIRGKVLSVVEEVGDRMLSIWIFRRVCRHYLNTGCHDGVAGYLSWRCTAQLQDVKGERMLAVRLISLGVH